jgi:hypothetical protein
MPQPSLNFSLYQFQYQFHHLLLLLLPRQKQKTLVSSQKRLKKKKSILYSEHEVGYPGGGYPRC